MLYNVSFTFCRLYGDTHTHTETHTHTTSTGKGVHLGDKDATGIAKALGRAVCWALRAPSCTFFT